jgi:hypothetical protein
MVMWVIKILSLLISTGPERTVSHPWHVLVWHLILACTLGHFSCRKGISSSLLVAGGIVKCKESCGKSIDLRFKDVDCIFYLPHQVITGEVSIAVLPRFENDACLTELRHNTDTGTGYLELNLQIQVWLYKCFLQVTCRYT